MTERNKKVWNNPELIKLEAATLNTIQLTGGIATDGSGETGAETS